MDVRGYAGFRMCKKLSALKASIKKWNKEVFGRIDESREALSRVVDNLDKIGESWELTPEEMAMRQDAGRRIWGLDRMEEISWR